MKKRIFGTLLMGAMLVSSMSTFVSCKDYDDDINSLQTQINSLSSLLDTKEATINNTLNTIQAQLSSLSSLEATLKGQIADGDAATLAAARQAVADAQAALQAAINTNRDELVKANAVQDAAILEAKTAAEQALAQLANLSSTMQPLVESITKDIAAAQAGLTQVQLDLADLTAKYSTLNDDLAKAITDIAELKIAVAGQAAALEAIGGQEGLAQVKADVATLLTNLTTLQGTVNALNAAQAQTAADIVGINATLAALQAAQANFADKTALDEVKADLTNVQTKIDVLENEIIPNINTMIAALAKSLRSLVYMPYLYVDGIESIEYPYLWDVSLTEVQIGKVIERRRQGTYDNRYDETYTKTIRDAASDKFPKLAHLYDWQESWKDLVYNTKGDKLKADDTEFFGPAWPVQYHMNPSRSAVAWENVKGWNVRKAEIITRSDAADGIKHTQFYVDGTPVFNVNNATGVLTVGLQVDKPNLLANRYSPSEWGGRPGYWHDDDTWAQDKDKNPVCQYDDIIALQVNTGGEVDTLVTSDYAMIYPERAELEGLVWVKSAKLGKKEGQFDEYGKWCGTLRHVWDTPQEALGEGVTDTYPDVELPYNGEVCLKDLLGVDLYIYGNTLNSGKSNPHCIAFNEAEFGQWGLSCEFQLVGYSIDGNKTIDSNYAEFTDGDENGVSKTGTIRARNVKEDGVTIDTESQTSVDREPLVRVLVKRGDRVVLDGYILVHITRQESKIVVDNYPAQDKTFDLCNGVEFTTNWSEFSYYVLTQTLDNMTKNDFDAQYGKQYNGVPDLVYYNRSTTADGGYVYPYVQLFEDTNGKLSEAKNYPGHVDYYYNAVGTTNHRFVWTISPEEAEYYTHDGNFENLPTTVTKYIRYTGHAGAKYNYIYVKLTLNIDRAIVAESGVKDKNANYWFKADLSEPETIGADDGWDAIVLNPSYPQDNQTLGTDYWFNIHNVTSTFAANMVQFTNTTGLEKGHKANINESIKDNNWGTGLAKFYFVPQNFTITAQNGTVYTITPQRNALDEEWNAFRCRYEDWDGNNLHNKDSKGNSIIYTTHKWGTPEENKAIHEKCAIDYRYGVYRNYYLYAVTDYGKPTASYTAIAYLNQNIGTGQIELMRNTATLNILNAIGYAENHANILEEFHAMVGVIADAGCDVAVNITERQDGADNQNAGTFYVSWQRPINVVEDANPMVDAKTNGDIIYTVDFLKLFDWRGPVSGAMSGNTQWLWAYYNIYQLMIDTRPANVLTNMHQSDPTKFVPMNTITTQAQLGVLDENGTPHLRTNWYIGLSTKLAGKNQAAANANLLRAMGLQPVNNVYKQEFAGGLFYANNGDNVEEFDVIVPVTVYYDWGQFVANVKVHIDRTLGN